jgi:hypothetical protein
MNKKHTILCANEKPPARLSSSFWHSVSWGWASWARGFESEVLEKNNERTIEEHKKNKKEDLRHHRQSPWFGGTTLAFHNVHYLCDKNSRERRFINQRTRRMKETKEKTKENQTNHDVDIW